MKKYLAELVGSFILALFGCGTAVVAGDKVGIVGIAMAFGFGLIAAAYGIGPISGCHINPARSFGPALLVGGHALAQVWLFLLIPSLGGLAAGLLFRTKALAAE
jgi:aquaporin Z